jgi:two-component system cell cycle sensor histidine kinase PleC
MQVAGAGMTEPTRGEAPGASHGLAREFETAGYALLLPSLRFADRKIERRFLADRLARGLPIIRSFLIGACVIVAFFGVLDALIIPEIKGTAWFIRFAIVCPYFIAVIALTFTRHFARWAQAMLAGSVLLTGIGIIGMIALAGEPGSALYYAGLIIVVIYGSSLFQLRCSVAAIVSIVLVALYQAVALWINPIPTKLLVSNDFFLGMSVAVGIFSAYLQEWAVRREFVAEERIRHEKARAEELRAEAESASRAKSDFLAVMSHELRTPLNAILGFSEVMRRRMFGPIGSERYIAYIDDIHQAANQLSGIIGDVLDLSRAEMGKLELQEDEVDLTTVADQCLRLLREKAGEQRLRLSLRPPSPPIPAMVRADARLLKQVLLNLTGNAIKFTQPGGSVTVAVEGAAESGWLLSVADTGIGMAETDLERVLEPFVQVESAYARQHGGIGLGLPLAAKIVALHGGSIAIKSKLGSGTTVTVTFPPSRSIAHPAASAA